MENQEIQKRVVDGIDNIFKEINDEIKGSRNEILGFQLKLKELRKKGKIYRVQESERGFIRWHFGGDLLRLQFSLEDDFDLPNGVYEIYDMEEDTFYLYFNPHEVQWKDLRFGVDGNGKIREIINLKEGNTGYDYLDDYKLLPGIDLALTLVLWEEDDNE